MKNIRFLALGGINEQGKNLYFLEINKSIFIINAGSKMPNLNGFGVDLIIPDLNYLEKKKNQIKAIIITNGELDNVGALPYIVKRFPKIPIYANQYSQIIIRDILAKHKVRSSTLKPLRKQNVFDDIVIKAFPVYFSFPLTMGLSFRYKNEQIIYLGDYFCFKNNFLLSQKDEDILKTKTKLLILGNTNVKEPGFIKNYNQDYLKFFKTLLFKNGRKIVAISSKRINEILVMVKNLVYNKKPFAIDNGHVLKILKTLQESNQVKIPANLLINFNEISKHKDIFIFVSEVGNRLYHKLNNISLNRDEKIKVKEGDNVLIAIGPIDSAEVFYYKILDQFYRLKIFPLVVNKNTYKSHHGAKGDIETVLKKLQPEWTIPVKSYFQDYTTLIELVEDIKMDPKKIVFVDNGEMFNINHKKYEIKPEKGAASEMLIDGLGIGDVSSAIINERQKMGNGGVIFLSFLYNKFKKKLTSKINYTFIGIVDDVGEQNKVREKVNKFLSEKILPDLDFDKLNKQKITIKKKVLNIIKKVVNKEPEVVVVIIEDN